MSLAFCHCCKAKIGYDGSTWGLESLLPAGDSDPTAVENLSSDVSRLGECKIVFAGNYNICGQAVRFADAQWPALKAYVEGGGRLYMVAEHSGEYPIGPPGTTSFICHTDLTRTRDFLSFMGSSLDLDGKLWSDLAVMVAGAANIATGQGSVFNMRVGAFSAVSGGTSVFTSSGGGGGDNDGAGLTVVAVEQIGSGFIFLSGDSNTWSETLSINPFGAKTWTRRLWEYADADVI